MSDFLLNRTALVVDAKTNSADNNTPLAIRMTIIDSSRQASANFSIFFRKPVRASLLRGRTFRHHLESDNIKSNALSRAGLAQRQRNRYPYFFHCISIYEKIASLIPKRNARNFQLALY